MSESRNSSRRRCVSFLGAFFALLVAYYVAVLTPAGDRAMYAYLELNARLAGAALGALAQHVRVSGIDIRSPHFGIAVRRGCDAIEPAWFFCSAVLAFPAPWRRKLAVLPWGVGVILALNIPRIVSLFLVGAYAPRWFPTLHLELWPVAFIVVSFAFWARWAAQVMPRGKHAVF